jgi:hypothetical protein
MKPDFCEGNMTAAKHTFSGAIITFGLLVVLAMNRLAANVTKQETTGMPGVNS